jgi:Tfp pilus assembly protein PilV
MSLNYAKTYQPLNTINNGSSYGKPLKVPVTVCSGLLENHMQCWRAGDVLITTTTTTLAPTEADPNATVDTISTYQMCYRHSAADQAQYNQLVTDDTNATTLAQQAVAAETKVEAEKS